MLTIRMYNIGIHLYTVEDTWIDWHLFNASSSFFIPVETGGILFPAEFIFMQIRAN